MVAILRLGTINAVMNGFGFPAGRSGIAPELPVFGRDVGAGIG